MAQIGADVVRQYTRYLQTGQRNLLMALYRPNSRMVRSGGGVTVTLLTLPDIEAEINSWDFTITRYLVFSCLSSNLGTLTMMIGSLRRMGSTRTRKFVQAIFLAPDPDSIANAYYILNEIFYFLDGPEHDESTVTLHSDEITDDNDPNSSTYVSEYEVTSRPALIASDNLHAAAIETGSFPSFPNPPACDLTSLSQTMESDETLNMSHITLHSST